ncbi:MAG: peptidoglycan-binding protein [Gammaproteobacteria bacterium]|nr:peptidoglycan-binding protein [Gammaproteobacteria bacterium]
MKFSQNVKENQHRNVIQAIQAELINAGYDPGLADGYNGPRTRAALKSFQRDHELKINGQTDKSALKSIKNSLVSDE